MAAPARGEQEVAAPGTSSTNDSGGPPGSDASTSRSERPGADGPAVGSDTRSSSSTTRQHHSRRPGSPWPCRWRTSRRGDGSGRAAPRGRCRAPATPRPGTSTTAVACQAVGPDPLPRTLVPMKATSGELPFGDGWTYEVKWDGMRALCFIDGARLRVQSVQRARRDGLVARAGRVARGGAGHHRRARRRAGGHRRRTADPTSASSSSACTSPTRPRWPPGGPRAGELRGLRPAPSRRPRPHRPPAGRSPAPARPGARARPALAVLAPARRRRRPCSPPPTERGLEGVVAKRLDSPYAPAGAPDRGSR